MVKGWVQEKLFWIGPADRWDGMMGFIVRIGFERLLHRDHHAQIVVLFTLFDDFGCLATLLLFLFLLSHFSFTFRHFWVISHE